MLLEWQRPRPSPALANPIQTSSNEPQFGTPGSHSHLKSPPPESATQQLLKRARPRADVDGEGSENIQKKKRRLRLNLITSRLSKPYATPATHIISRNSLRSGIWARQKVLGNNLLHKAACLNAIRLRRLAAKEAEQRRSEFARMVSMYDNVYVTDLDEMTDGSRKQQPSSDSASPPRQNTPSPPPLNLSGYDAFDYEDDSADEDDEDTSENGLVYSDFNALSADDATCDDDSFLDPFGGNESEQPIGLGSSKEAIELLLNNERCDEVSVAH